MNLQDSSGPYVACPYCLTRISDLEVEIEKSETHHAREKVFKSKENPPTCHYHLGYLSERKDKAEIPDECITCKFLLECMLQKMRA